MTIKTIYVINHSHTDIGFTADQPILWELQARYIQTALDEIERSTQDAADESAFRWTVETLDLSREEWYRLFVAGRGEELP